MEEGSRPARPNNIPSQIAPFVGREQELKALAALLREPKRRLVTLTGPGGIGKTRLGFEVAERLTPHYEGGAWVVELACIDDPSLLPQRVAVALGIKEAQDDALLDALIAHLRPQHLLLVLDNCEHLQGACAQLARDLLASCASVDLLATSREPLHIAGESMWPVPPLGVPDLANLPRAEDLLRTESVRLFVDRAERVFPMFSITEENAPTVAEVCYRLDGLPLAIELAASWVRVLSVSQILDRLDDHLALLAGTDRTVPARQRTMEAALDWSYDLLTEQERMLFLRLSVFGGGFSLQAAETVCSGNGLEPDSILDLLSRLVDKSLVMVERGQGQERRCRLLATVRQYAIMRLERTGDMAFWHDRHLDWCMVLAERARPSIGSAAGRASFARLDSEADNFSMALEWSIESGAADKSLRLAGALGWYWYVRGNLHQGRYWLKEALAAGKGASSASRASALNTAGALAVLQNDHARATELLQEAVRLDCSSHCSRVAAWSLQELGMVAHSSGCYSRAEERFAESMSLFRELGDDAGIASVLLHQGISAHYQGDETRAAALLLKSLTSLQEAGDAVGTAQALLGLGLVARRKNDVVQAQAFSQEALQIAHEEGARLEVAQCIEGLAGLACEQRQTRRAVRLFGAAEGLRSIIGTDLPHGQRADHARDIEVLRAQMTVQEFASTWSAGLEFTPEQAIAYALEEENAARGSERPPARSLTALQMAKHRYGGLTTREREVAALVTQGLTNSAIGAELFVTVRTVEAHITHILRKLGFSSRAQIAAWAIDRGLTQAPKTLQEQMNAL